MWMKKGRLQKKCPIRPRNELLMRLVFGTGEDEKYIKKEPGWEIQKEIFWVESELIIDWRNAEDLDAMPICLT